VPVVDVLQDVAVGLPDGARRVERLPARELRQQLRDLPVVGVRDATEPDAVKAGDEKPARTGR
jgi:hypothetical protein